MTKNENWWFANFGSFKETQDERKCRIKEEQAITLACDTRNTEVICALEECLSITPEIQKHSDGVARFTIVKDGIISEIEIITTRLES